MTPQNRQGLSVGPQVIFGIAVVVFGLLLTASNLGIGRVTNVLRFAPLLLSVLGATLLIDKEASGSRRLIGIALVIAGIWQTANTAFGLGIYIEDYWPLALVGLGIFLVMRSIGARNGAEDYTNVGTSSGGAMGSSMSSGTSAYRASDSTGAPAAPVDFSREESLNVFAFMGGVRRNLVSPTFRRGNATAVMGGVVIDMRQSAATGAESVIECFAMWGGIEILVPPDWQVVNEISPIMGGVDDKSTHTQPVRHRLVLKGVVFMGGVEIKS
jgi:hypothetical protein